MPVMSVAKFERFFRVAAGLDIDKADLKRYSDFVHQKIRDLLIRAVANAKANRRDIIEPQDLPITKGLQECMHLFRDLDEEIELKPILEHLSTLPRLELDYTTLLTLLPKGTAGALLLSEGKSPRVYLAR